MMECSTTIVLDDSGQLTVNSICVDEAICFTLDVADKVVDFRINATTKEATLADIVPLARTISSKLAIAFLDTLGKDGRIVACCKGCSACCNYLIPLSVPEAFRLRQELLLQPEDDLNRILQSCLDTTQSMLDIRPPAFSSQSGQSQIDRISKWYSGFKLACPFLSDGLCVSYEQRPLACREHIVTGSSFFCQPDHGGAPDVATMPVSVLEALGQLTAELEESGIEAVVLPLVFVWLHDNLERAERTWPWVTMVKRFVEILKQTVPKDSEVFAKSS